VTAEAGRAYGATVAKWRLSRRLVTMRKRVGMRVSEVDDQLGWNRGRLQRIEGNRWTIPDPSYIRDLLRLYRASDKEQAELLDLVQHGRARLWWRDYAGDRNDEARVFENEFPGFENDAARISIYMPLVIRPDRTSRLSCKLAPSRQCGVNVRSRLGCGVSRFSIATMALLPG
jgi:hypothetical protein